MSDSESEEIPVPFFFINESAGDEIELDKTLEAKTLISKNSQVSTTTRARHDRVIEVQGPGTTGAALPSWR